jgi:hypothetical protein
MTSFEGDIAPISNEEVGLTGQSVTVGLGGLIIFAGATLTPAGTLSTSAVGSVDVTSNPIPFTLSGLSTTSAVGSLSPSLTEIVSLTGVSTTSAVGSLTSEIQQILTGVSATSSVGSPIVAIGVPLTGVSTTSSVGVISPNDVMGLTGLEATTSVGSVGTLGYKHITATQSANYTTVTHA